MAEILRTIRLYGKLGARFGRVHQMAVLNAPEAARALSEQIPGFRQEFSRGTFAIFLGKKNLTLDELETLPGTEDIRIAPMVSGRKGGGLIASLVGAVVLVVGVVFTNPYIMAAGAAIMIGGALMNKSAVPKGLGTQDKEASRASYVFNGAVNTQAQGGPVPLAYGELIVGSAVASAGIYAEDKQ